MFTVSWKRRSWPKSTRATNRALCGRSWLLHPSRVEFGALCDLADVDAGVCEGVTIGNHTLIAGGGNQGLRGTGEAKISIKEGSVAVMRCWSKIHLSEPKEQSRLDP